MNDLPIFYNEAEEWTRALFLYDAALKELNTKLQIWNDEFKLAHQYNPIEHITSRVKTPQSIAKKMRRNGRELTIANIMDYVNDVAGIRIICSFTSDIYRIAELITSQTEINVLKVKDYIKTPKENGYTSYHMIVSIPVSLSSEVINTKVEIQIRTIAMDFWASLEHKIYYKFEGNAPVHIRRELKECADLVSFLDKKMLSINDEVKLLSQDPYGTYEEPFDESKQILSEIHEIVDSAEKVELHTMVESAERAELHTMFDVADDQKSHTIDVTEEEYRELQGEYGEYREVESAGNKVNENGAAIKNKQVTEKQKAGKNKNAQDMKKSGTEDDKLPFPKNAFTFRNKNAGRG